MKFYILDSKDHQWGDYYPILMHGMSCHSSRENGLIQLERTGPFVPPLSLPGLGDIVVTDTFRQQLEESGLIGFRYQPVIKKLIVYSDWHTWNMNADEPKNYPKGGEPEDYILDHPHSEYVSQQIGSLWEVMLNESSRVFRVESDDSLIDVYLKLDSWQGEDLFGASGIRYIYATEKAKKWFEKKIGNYVSFIEAKTK